MLPVWENYFENVTGVCTQYYTVSQKKQDT